MSKSRYRVLTVSVVHSFPGPVGNFISNYQNINRVRIRRTVLKQKELGPIPNEELVLVEYPELKSLDPDHWKDQDHYAVLSLPKLRHRATLEQIRLAYRKAVLKHHPDKRRRNGEAIDECDDYFTCITRAYEQLGSLETKRAYDSIDPNFDDDVPPINSESRENFYNVFSPVFEHNIRWSLIPDVPLLGDKWSSIKEVDAFYDFWYNFNSWREYSYLDEEKKEKAEDAYERRWMEKQNRAARAVRKKEENQRIRQLVDNAYACDPRIKRYKEQEKKKKEDEKAARADAIRKANEEKLAEERRLQQEKDNEKKRLEDEAKKKQAEAKKEKEREKKLIKKERQRLKVFCKKHNHFRESESEQLELMDKINHLCVAIDLLTIQKLNESIDATNTTEAAQELVEKELDKLQAKVDEEKQRHLASASSKTKNGSASSGDKKHGPVWSYEDLQVLIKSVNLFPAGTNNRWETVANYVNTHASYKSRSGKDCLARAKNLKESELKAEANQKAFSKFQEKHLTDTKKAEPADGNITQRFDGPKPWTSEEQKRLEQALKTYPSAPQRWDKIAESVTSRTKKECMLRYKELVGMVKAKKAISQQTKKP